MSNVSGNIVPAGIGTHVEDPDVIHFRPLRTRYQTRGRAGIALNVTSMVDMALLLLKFFIITTTFAQLEGTLSARMPRVSGAVSVPLPIQPIIVNVSVSEDDPQGCSIRLEGLAQPVQDFESLHHLLLQLQQRPGFDAQTPVVVRGESDVAWDHMVSAWNAALRAGYQTVAFAER